MKPDNVQINRVRIVDVNLPIVPQAQRAAIVRTAVQFFVIRRFAVVLTGKLEVVLFRQHCQQTRRRNTKRSRRSVRP